MRSAKIFFDRHHDELNYRCNVFIHPPPRFRTPPHVMVNQIAVLAMVTNCKNLQLVTKLTVGDDTFYSQ